MVSCRGKTSSQSFNILLGLVLAVLQPTASTLMTSSRLVLQRLTATQLHRPTTPFRSTAMKAEDHWLAHWVPSSLSQQSLTWIMTICRVGGRGLRSWRICTGPKTAPLMMVMMVKTLNSGLTEWTPPISDLLIPWGFVTWGLTLPSFRLLPTTNWSVHANLSTNVNSSSSLAPPWSSKTICYWTCDDRLDSNPKCLLSLLYLFPSLYFYRLEHCRAGSFVMSPFVCLEVNCWEKKLLYDQNDLLKLFSLLEVLYTFVDWIHLLPQWFLREILFP